MLSRVNNPDSSGGDAGCSSDAFGRRGPPERIVREVAAVVDSHIQLIVLATEETTATQQVSHRPIKCQSRLWPQRGTKFNGSHHGDDPLLRPTGIQIATKRYASLQAMAPTNVKTVHQTSLLHIEGTTSIDSDCCRLPTTRAFSATKRTNYAPISFGQQVQISRDPFCWCPCMVINVIVQYDDGFLPDIILLTQCYYHRGTRLNAMKRFCSFSY